MTQVKIKDIVVDKEVYPRMQDTWQKAYEYSMGLKAGNVFPPILLGKLKGKIILVDGLHRIKANQLLDRTTIEATIKPYSSKKQLFIDAVKANLHGKPLTFMDKTMIFGKLRNYKVADAVISQLLGTPIEKFCVYSENLLTKDGRSIPIRSVIRQALEDQQITEKDAVRITLSNQNPGDMTSNTAIHAVREVIGLLENNLVSFENKATSEACLTLFNLLKVKLRLEEGVPA